MSDYVTSVEIQLHKLRAALLRDDEYIVNTTLSFFFESVLDNQGYCSIGDEKLLAKTYQLLASAVDSVIQERLTGLYSHLLLMHAIHDKLYAILDGSIDLDVLLTGYFDSWPMLGQPLACSFDDSVKQQLAAIREARDTEHKLRSFIDVYFGYLNEHGYATQVDHMRQPVELALEGYKHAHRWSTHGLFVVHSEGEVYGIKVRQVGAGTGSINAIDSIDVDMEKAAKGALMCVMPIWPQTGLWNWAWAIERGDISFGGNSIGLALTMGILAQAENFDIDAYTAFTGCVHWDTGEVTRIDNLEAKLAAARSLGIRRVFIPSENYAELANTEGLKIVPVSSVQEAREWLLSRPVGQNGTQLEQLAEAKLRQLELTLASQNITPMGSITREKHLKRLVFTDHRERVTITVHHGKRGLKLDIQPSTSVLVPTIRKASEPIFGPVQDEAEQKPKQSRPEQAKYVVTNTDVQQRIETYLFAGGDAVRETENNCIFRAKIVRSHQIVYVRLFQTGTLTVAGPNPLFDEIDEKIQKLLGPPAPIVNTQANDQLRRHAQIAAVEAVELGERWIGTDESGKGDYFGPLIGAAVFVDDRIVQLLTELGVRDSKNLTDKQNLELATSIHRVCGKAAQTVVIPPHRYNALYEQFRQEGKTLNHLLAWMHQRAVENLLESLPPLGEITVLVDKFADESNIEGRRARSKEFEKSKQAKFVQLPKAEANVAVAAASIIARASFLESLDRLSQQYHVRLPKGASDPAIVNIGRRIVDQHGPNELSKIAKLHFKTTAKIVSTR